MAGFQPGGSPVAVAGQRTAARSLLAALPLVTAVVTTRDQIGRRGPLLVRGWRYVTNPVQCATVVDDRRRPQPPATGAPRRQASPSGQAGNLHATDAVGFACSYAFAFARLGCGTQIADALRDRRYRHAGRDHGVPDRGEERRVR